MSVVLRAEHGFADFAQCVRGVALSLHLRLEPLGIAVR